MIGPRTCPAARQPLRLLERDKRDDEIDDVLISLFQTIIPFINKETPNALPAPFFLFIWVMI